MVKKHDGNWRMCVDFTDLNKVCPPDCYPLPEIDWKVESFCGYPFEYFLDAYKGYHQIQLAVTDEEKTAFHTGQGVYCYTKMPFGLKNSGATYQRLMDKDFDNQIGWNIEVYVDDLVVKSYTEAEMLRDIDETFYTLRKINMKLIPKKCTFGEAEGVFLGYVVTPEGIKPYKNPPAAPVAETQQDPWTLFTDGSSCVDGSGARLIQTNPKRIELIYTLRFQFAPSNNEVKYEALIAGLWITAHMGVKNVHEGGKKAPHQGPTIRIIRGNSLQAVVPYAVVKMSWTAPGGSNGLVERANRSLREGIKAILGEGNKNWVEELPHVLWAHRTMIKSSHDDTPFSLTYGTEAVIPAEIGMPTCRTATVDVVYNDEELRQNLDMLEERCERAAIREAKAKLKMTKYYNARVRGVTFRSGDFVYRSNDTSHAVAWGKLGPKWEGPYEVTEALGDGAYKLRSTDGTVLPRTWNITNLKRCYL
nr:reverse transcriptase domain-containing protein [Tanacetum cinerariifolium]